jgi:hypothetical protein
MLPLSLSLSLLMLSMIVDVDQQSQMIRHPAIGTCKTRTTAGTGTVLPGYGNVRPVPVPEHTREHIITVLPVPVSCLSRPDYTCCTSFSGTHCATMPTPQTFLIVVSIPFDITTLLLLSLRAFLLFFQCSLAYLTVFYIYCLENLSPLSCLATALCTNTEVRYLLTMHSFSYSPLYLY